MKQTFQITVDSDYVEPTGVIETDEEYLNFVFNKFVPSYMKQHDTADILSGITAAKDARNSSVPVTPVTPDAPVDPVVTVEPVEPEVIVDPSTNTAA